MRNRTWGLTLLLSLGAFLMMLVSLGLSGFFSMLLFRLEIIKGVSRESMLSGFAVMSIVFGVTISHTIIKRTMAPIEEISEATKEVANGNFDIHLHTRSHAAEINTMARNFTVMVQELANTETFRQDFISNVSHEFKTPLAAIEGYASLLQSKDLSEEKRLFFAGKILNNTRRLSALTGNILQLSRLENQDISPRKEIFSLDEQLRECVLLYEADWTGKQLTLDVDLDSTDYLGNPEMLAQVWMNLLGNAIKFVDEGGTVRVLLRREPHKLKIHICDTGPGISPEVQKRIFEKFYQGDTSHATAGNGLGLTLAKRIIDLHNGQITVSSRVGKGSTFTVTLPMP